MLFRLNNNAIHTPVIDTQKKVNILITCKSYKKDNQLVFEFKKIYSH